MSSNLPKGWRSGKVEDFFTLQRGFDLTEKQAVPGSIPVYSSSGISYFHNRSVVKGPGVVTGRKGKLGRVFYVEADYWPHDTSLWVKDFKGNDPKFIKYFLDALQLERFDAASSVPTLNRNTVHALKCFFPPHNEQKQIALVLSTWDNAIEKTERLIEAKEKRFSRLLNRLINQGSVKREWRRMKLGEVAEIDKGQQLNVADMVDTGKYYALNGGIEPSGFTNNWNTLENTITISEGGNSCGFVNFNSEKFWCGGHCYALNNLNNEVAKKYLYHFLKAYEKSLMSMRVGSGLPNIQKKALHNFSVTFPPLSEQSRIAETLNTARQEIDLLKKQAEAYRKQKRGLMQKLLTGQSRVKTDEGER